MFVDLKLMIDEYKNFLKRNKEELFTYSTVGSGVLLYFFILLGGVATLSTVRTFVGNSKELNVYRENLATFQKCAEKVTLPPAVETYCGETPREPVILW